MATTTTITNAQALAQAIELAKAAGNAELTSKLERMYEVATKPRKKSNTPSKSQQMNSKLAQEIADTLRAKGNEPVSAKWISENVRYVASPQKATAIIRQGVKDGTLVRLVVDGKPLCQAA